MKIVVSYNCRELLLVDKAAQKAYNKEKEI